MINDITRTIDWCKGRIKATEHARRQLPFETFDKVRHSKLSRRLKHYRICLAALESQLLINKETNRCSNCGQHGTILTALAFANHGIIISLCSTCESQLFETLNNKGD